MSSTRTVKHRLKRSSEQCKLDAISRSKSPGALLSGDNTVLEVFMVGCKVGYRGGKEAIKCIQQRHQNDPWSDISDLD